MLRLVNQHRSAANLPPLRWCQNLARAAQSYSEVLEGWGAISHQGPDGSTPRSRAREAGYTAWRQVGENLAFGYPDAASVVEGWMDSPSHRANLMDPGYRDAGFGLTERLGSRANWFWVQKFGPGGEC
jgi:uncharacterized protein YkwD